MFPSSGFRLPLSATGDGARVAVGRRSPAASWLSRSEEARPWTAVPRGLLEVRGELLLLFYGPTVYRSCTAFGGGRIPPSSHQSAAALPARWAEAKRSFRRMAREAE